MIQRHESNIMCHIISSDYVIKIYNAFDINVEMYPITSNEYTDKC